MIAPTPPHDPLTPDEFADMMRTVEKWPAPRRWYDRPAALARRHARLLAFVMWAGMAWLAYISAWFVPFVAGSLATFGALLVWGEAK